MKIAKIYISFLFAALLLLSAFLVLQRSTNESVKIDEKYANPIQKNVLDALKDLHEEGRRIKRTFQNNNNAPLVALSEKLKYDFYIFKDQEVAFWSDFRFVPPYRKLKGLYDTKYVDFQEGKYLVHRTSFLTGGGNHIEIYCLLPLFYDYKINNIYVKSHYNKAIIPHADIVITEALGEDGVVIHDANDKYLFSIDSGEIEEVFNYQAFYVSVLLFTLSFLFALLFAHFFRKRLKKSPLLGFLSLAIVLLSYRLFFLFFFNFGIVALDILIFSPEEYASSQWAPSIGDMLINLLTCLFLLYDLGARYYKSVNYYRLEKSPKWLKHSLSIVIVVLSYYLLEFHFHVLSNIYLHSKIELDITKDISPSAIRFIAFAIFVIISFIYFLGSNMLARIFIHFNRSLTETSYLLALGSLAYNLISYTQGTFNWVLVLVHGVFFLTSVYLLLPKSLNKFRYLTTIYVFLGMLVGAISGAYIIYKFGVNRTQINKKKYAESLLNEKDLYAEFALDQIHNQIKKDVTIKQTILQPLILNKDVIVQKIKRHYIHNSLENYQIEIHTYDRLGQPLKNKDSPPLKTYNDIFRLPEYATEYDDIYFVSETDAVSIGANLLKEYVCFFPIYDDSTQCGTVIIDLQQKKDKQENVYPELLLDKRFRQPEETKNYSYAVYTNSKLLYKYGAYNYAKDFRKNFLKFASLYENGYSYNDYNHTALLGKNGRIVVISSEDYSSQKIFANFSALFLTLLAYTMMGLFIYVIFARKLSFKNTYASRIQLYLNIAFFLPLIVVSMVTLSLISDSYQNELQNNFILKAQKSSRSITVALEKYNNGYKAEKFLKALLNKVALYSETDINLFGKDGKIITTNQPDIYDSGIISPYINPKAYTYIVEKKDNNILLPESVGKLNYRSVYTAIYSSDNNELLGILSIPFFDAEDEQNKRIIDILSTIMSIFTATFILFLIISYFASRILTVPLNLITQKIKKTSLQNTNEPLYWDTEDEIGLLVSEYNRMIINLEENKIVLSKSEKESAWREMAKQVAHEIKNPLTPMKLSLQHLQFKLSRTYEDINTMIDKPINNILQQIDTLSDIATSFSSFAKMPTPKNEKFDLSLTVRNTVQLHRDDANKNMILHIAKNNYFVNGDQQLMGRIITNLLLNAEQSVVQGNTPEIYINLYKVNQEVLLEIRDNGAGIPSEIQKKIFIPNFSTKFTGSGIGLALAKRGIEHAGGKIWFETRENKGTCFFIKLPQAN